MLCHMRAEVHWAVANHYKYQLSTYFRPLPVARKVS